MSFAEIRDQVTMLSPSEQEELARHLQLLEISRDPEVIRESQRAMRDIDNGKFVTAEKLHALLAKRGS